MPKRSKTEAAKSKVESAVALGGLGGTIGGPFGAGVGAITGLIIGDEKTVLPLDMVAIPAYQAFMIQGTPALQIYMRAGETLVPTGGNVKDVMEVMEDPTSVASDKPRLARRRKTAYQRRYAKSFDKVKGKDKLKSGKWKKDGFKRAVREAHKLAGGK